MSKKQAERKDYERDGSLIRETIPNDLADVMGAMFLTGWNYNYETWVREDDGAVVVDFYGFRVNKLGEPEAKARAINMRCMYIDGAWVTDREQTGLMKTQVGKDGKHIQPHSVDYLVEYVGKNINDWEFAPIFDAGDVDIDEEEIDLEDEPKPETKPKRGRGRGKTAKSDDGKQLALTA
ncbi:hypothetical protein SEA_OBLADI_154 [Gordonia phage ObLaDi]|uniref:Uncharacterized protein n=3 Tax=Cafassovirus TaxID=3425056 RepID=A0A9E7QBY1_9CAUD|nr:hypothetical protein SEA_CAFASSO_154 [Gordonia phage Cafasso]UVK59892.1 hypothetical protein SEA_ALEEMILY_152 [Gordonia phage Aleemily]UXE03877.1 hypothetical protein SEA_OBLADI_154 [Gordonia phage ObLaDi]